MSQEQWPVHPLCIHDLLQSMGGTQNNTNEKPSINLHECQTRYQNQIMAREGLWKVFWHNEQPSSMLGDNTLPAFSSYRIVGSLQGQRILTHYTANYGGSGTFTYALILTGLPLSGSSLSSGNIELSTIVATGERCFGGIDDLLISDPESFLITRRVTPAAMMTYSNEQADTSGLPDCALCCAGTVTEMYNLNSQPELKSVTLFPHQKSNNDNQQTACFYQQAPSLQKDRIELDAEGLTSLQRLFQQECTGK